LIAIGAAAVSLAGLPFAGMPASAAWPWLIGSAVIHLLYFAALKTKQAVAIPDGLREAIEAYRRRTAAGAA
jgi:hypothetical protein